MTHFFITGWIRKNNVVDLKKVYPVVQINLQPRMLLSDTVVQYAAQGSIDAPAIDGSIELSQVNSLAYYIWAVSAEVKGFYARYLIFPEGQPSGDLYVIATDDLSEVAAPAPTPSPGPTPTPTPSPGPVIEDCVFPTLQWNLIQVLSDLIEWIGCILHNIITILQWVIDWFLHFSDHLDAWISGLFGFDPAGNFWEQLSHDIDVRVSNRLGVDPDKPLLDEIARKLLEWFFTILDAKADEDLQNRGWK